MFDEQPVHNVLSVTRRYENGVPRILLTVSANDDILAALDLNVESAQELLYELDEVLQNIDELYYDYED